MAVINLPPAPRDKKDLTKVDPRFYDWTDRLLKAINILAPIAAGGTVSSVSVATANGISGTVATATTTPVITLSIGTLPTLTVTATITGSVSGNAGTATLAAAATVLATPRAINGVNFDGSAAITVTAAAGTLSGATLAAGVTASSLTSVGTLTSLVMGGSITGVAGLTMASGQILAATGTNAAPGYSFAADPDTGFLTGTDAIYVSLGGTGRFFYRTTGFQFLTGGASNLLDINNNELVKFTATTSAVNEITVTNAATGNAPSLSATGSDANIDLTLATKGSGVFKLNYGATNGGQLELTKWLCGASSRNRVTIQNAAAGTNASISAADSTDANAGINVMYKGTGGIGIGVTASGARLHLPAGSTTIAAMKFTSGTNLTTPVAGASEYDGRFTLTDTDAARRHIVQAAASTKVVAAAPYANDGYVELTIDGTTHKFMTTA